MTSPQKTIKNQLGFSLIEMLVSTSIFIMVITVAVGALLVVIDANAKAQNMQEVMTNLTFALDSMTREIRTGRGFYCDTTIPVNLHDTDTRDCTRGQTISIVEGGSSLTDETDTRRGAGRVAYRYNSSNATIERRVGRGNGWQAVTSPDVNITNAYFTLRNSDPNDNIQANVTIYIEGETESLIGLNSDFQLQTTIAKRILDLR